MNVETVSMDPRIARIHYTDYRRKVREHRALRLAEAEKKIKDGGKLFRQGRTERSQIEKEDEILMASYRAMARGQRILNLGSVIRAAGVDTKTRLPVLAAAGANWKHAFLQVDHGLVSFADKEWPRWSYGKQRYSDPVISIPATGFPNELLNSYWRREQKLPDASRSHALVPSVPVHLRPAGDLSGYTILWEAEWKPAAPKDPFLLKHIAGQMYTVVAQWDLTPVEQMVLEGRIS